MTSEMKNVQSFPGLFFNLVAPEKVSEVEHEINRYRNATITSDIPGNVSIPHIELHSIDSLVQFCVQLKALVQHVNPNIAGETDKEWCIGIHPYINDANRLSFYFIPTIVKKETLNTQGTSVLKDSFADYLDILHSSNTIIKEIVKDNIYNIGNHYP